MLTRRDFIAALAAIGVTACTRAEEQVVAGRFGIVLNGDSAGSSSDADRAALRVDNSTALTVGCFFQQFATEGLAAILTQMPVLGGAGNSRFAITTSSSGTGIACFSSNAAGTYQTGINGVTANGTWAAGSRRHVAAVYDGTAAAADRWKVYIDGTLVAFSTTAGTFPATLAATSTYPIEAGRWDGGQLTPAGIFDTITLHSSALSAGNVALLAAGTHVSTGWVDTWPCDDENGETLHSVTGSNNGTLYPTTVGPRFVTRSFAGASTGTSIRIMPLGDSELVTTGTNGGPRVEVYSRLVSDGFSVDFVGSQTTGDPSITGFDTAHEAVSGKRIGASSGVASTIRGDLSARMTSYLPTSYAGRRVVWLRAGKNDLGTDGITGAACATRLYDCVVEGQSYQSGATWFIQTPAHWTNGSYSAALAAYVAAMPAQVTALQAAGIDAHFVDTYSYGTTRDLSDGTHEGKAGCMKSASIVYQAMRDVLLPTTAGIETGLHRGGAADPFYERGGGDSPAYARGGAARARW